MGHKALIVLSGGQDSTTCLYWAKQNGYECHCVTFDYGQRHAVEIDAAMRIALMAHVATHEVIELGAILKGTSPLISDAKLEQYQDMNSLPGGLEKTFVPLRNQLFLTIAANRAYLLGCDVIVTGVCEEDSGGYPDCRQDFIFHLQDAMNRGAFTGENGTPKPIRIETPLMYKTKADSVEMALDIDGCYAALAWTHTAYDGHYPPTGKDHATLLRAKGFAMANIPDPLVLRAVVEEKMTLPEETNYSDMAVEKALARLEQDNWLADPTGGLV